MINDAKFKTTKENIMSQNWYIKNMNKNEYITGNGNGNFYSTLRNDNPLFIMWVIMRIWEGDNIKFFPEDKIPNGYSGILEATNKTKEFRRKFEDEHIAILYK